MLWRFLDDAFVAVVDDFSLVLVLGAAASALLDVDDDAAATSTEDEDADDGVNVERKIDFHLNMIVCDNGLIVGNSFFLISFKKSTINVA